MKYLTFIPILCWIISGSISAQQSVFTVASNPWEESLGNHRAVLQVKESADAVKMNIIWRRHDKDPEKRRFIIIEASSGDTISNIHRLEVTNENCALVFGPVKNPGTYFFYYLPYVVQKQYGFYNHDYPGPEALPDKQWVEENHLSGLSKLESLPVAKVTEIQSRTTFDSFYPMEVIALSSEKEKLVARSNQDFLVFPESREFPIRMMDDIPLRWIKGGPSNSFSGTALKNEYYTFQLGLFASKKNIQNLKVTFSDLENDKSIVPATKLTCFNTGGVDPYGKHFTKIVEVARGQVQPLWIGVDIPVDITAGTYEGSVTISADDVKSQSILVRLVIENKLLPDRGDSQLWRHSRLRWLNSTLGIDDQPTKPYLPIVSLDDRSFELSGKKLHLDEYLLPASIQVYDIEVLENAISFLVETKKGILTFQTAENVEVLKDEAGILSASWESQSPDLHLLGTGVLEADGYLSYTIKLQAKNDIQLQDVRLEIPMKNTIATYMMGMGLPGTKTPNNHQAGWQGPHDSFWMGNESGGLWCELRGSNYHGPLLNLYKPAPPESWYNQNKGGFQIENGRGVTKAIVYSGSRSLKNGEEIEFEWSFLITPVKKINYQSQFLDRYFHNGLEPIPSDQDLASGVKIVNLHHANEFNPHINYPFIAVEEMKSFVDDMHQKGQKVKIYYTIRELTNYTAELWALRSLGHEILGDGGGGGYPWLREHLVDGYRPQWYQYFPDKSADASIVNAPGDSRWYNYYIEGLAWMVRNVDIDGLYLDDVSYDRRTLKRIRKVLDREKPDCLLDLHSNTGFSKGPATQYAEFFPFVDKIWFGESFKYDNMPPENWLVEVSGIPFGHMGDMLHRGGNRWLGMLFGMTVRHPWLTDGIVCDPRPIWKVWDEFGIHEAKMIGFWEENLMVTTDHPEVKATAYLKPGKLLISLGNFTDERQKIHLSLDWKALELDPNDIRIICPTIKDFQPFKEFKINQAIDIEPRKGWLIVVK